jgi:hypothetical protein
VEKYGGPAAERRDQSLPVPPRLAEPAAAKVALQAGLADVVEYAGVDDVDPVDRAPDGVTGEQAAEAFDIGELRHAFDVPHFRRSNNRWQGSGRAGSVADLFLRWLPVFVKDRNEPDAVRGGIW